MDISSEDENSDLSTKSFIPNESTQQVHNLQGAVEVHQQSEDLYTED